MTEPAFDRSVAQGSGTSSNSSHFPARLSLVKSNGPESRTASFRSRLHRTKIKSRVDIATVPVTDKNSITSVWAWFTLLLIGCGFTFGPDKLHSAPSYAAIDGILRENLHMGWRPLGVLFLIAALLILIPRRRTRYLGNYIGALLYLLFDAGLLYALFLGQLLAFPALPLWALAAVVHLDAVTKLSVRRMSGLSSWIRGRRKEK